MARVRIPGSRRRGMASILALCTLVGIGTASAQDGAPKQRYGLNGDAQSPDLAGLWLGTFTIAPGGRAQTPIPERKYNQWRPWPLPLTPEYQRRVDERAAALAEGRELGDAGIRCVSNGMPWKIVVNPGLPIEVIQTPGLVSFWGGLRPIMIYTDGRPHPKNLVPTYEGHSTGYWIGDVLHVETVGIIASTRIDGSYNPHSADIRLEWTIERVAPDRLHVRMTLHDPLAYTEPLATTIIYEQLTAPQMDLIDDASCFENNRHVQTQDVDDGSGFIRY